MVMIIHSMAVVISHICEILDLLLLNYKGGKLDLYALTATLWTIGHDC